MVFPNISDILSDFIAGILIAIIIPIVLLIKKGYFDKLFYWMINRRFPIKIQSFLAIENELKTDFSILSWKEFQKMSNFKSIEPNLGQY